MRQETCRSSSKLDKASFVIWNLLFTPSSRPLSRPLPFTSRYLASLLYLLSLFKSCSLPTSYRFSQSTSFSLLAHQSISANMVKILTLANCLLATFVGQSTGHFLMKWPPSIGFDDTPPCGSFTVDFSKDNVTDFHVGGDALAMVRRS